MIIDQVMARKIYTHLKLNLNQCIHLQEEFANGKESGAVETMMAQLQSVNIEDKVKQPSTSS